MKKVTLLATLLVSGFAGSALAQETSKSDVQKAVCAGKATLKEAVDGM